LLLLNCQSNIRRRYITERITDAFSITTVATDPEKNWLMHFSAVRANVVVSALPQIVSYGD
jgi:hypothetical protein